MNILIIHNRYVYPGGEDEVVKSEKALLEENGHHVHLYERSNTEIQSYHLLQKIRFALYDTHYSKKSYNDIRVLIKRRKIDIVHIHNTFTTISPSVYYACQDQNIPIVQTLHNYRFLCPIALFYRKQKICEECLTKGRKAAVLNRCWKNSYLYSAILTKTIDRFYDKGILEKKIGRFIALSQFSKDKFVECGFNEKRISIKSNFLKNDPKTSQRKKSFALYVGGFHSYKGLQTLLKAWNLLKGSFPLKVIGDGPLKNELVPTINRSNIEICGQKSNEEVLQLLKDCSFLIFPSECYENFPLTIVEAYASGVPIVASDIGAMKELIISGKTGLSFKAGDAQDLADKVTTFIEDHSLVEKMGASARLEYEQKYTKEKNYQELIKIYNQTIELSR